MGIKRIVDTSFWTDEKTMDLFSPEDRYFMLYILTNPHTTQLGIYPINIKYMALELGYSVDVIKVLLDRFETKYNILKYSEKTNEVAVKNFLKYSIVRGGTPVEDCLKREIKSVKDSLLKQYVYDNLIRFHDINETVKKILPLLNANANANANENEVSYHDSYNDSCHDTQKKKTKPVKHKYGEYNNVLLSDEDMEKLKNEFGDYEERIERLSSYMASSGKSYKNHLATIRNWARKDKEKQTSKSSKPSNTVVLTDEEKKLNEDVLRMLGEI
jgi:hypothetical protein